MDKPQALSSLSIGASPSEETPSSGEYTLVLNNSCEMEPYIENITKVMKSCLIMNPNDMPFEFYKDPKKDPKLCWRSLLPQPHDVEYPPFAYFFLTINKPSNDVLATLHLAQDEKTKTQAIIKNMMVSLEHQRKGLGKKLVALAEDQCRKYNKTKVVAHAIVGSSGYHLFTKMGYKEEKIIAIGERGSILPKDHACFFKDMP
ncbi:hypothetical protein PG985_003109 [Apiospora marii]|uniref:N-acetyltransferase domain-containing protein n=1 Tax=Apiospora marii TaxID=335849 RepID=A0ABR1RUN0_9PEZI